MKHRIVVIDDEVAIRDSLKMILEYDGYECLLAPSGQAGLACVQRDDPDLVFLDVKMPGMDGIEVLRKIRAIDELLPVVIISGHGTVSTAVEATRLGAFDFLEKPLSTDRVSVTIRNALNQRQLRAENRSWRRAAEARHEMVGESRALRAMTEEIRRAAPVRSAVLIQGESGVGKELVADAIHTLSPRRAAKLIKVHCAALTETLLESELFGHERGAFTGAVARRRGRFELADGGTLFLDEVADMSLKTQARVLRVLENQRFYPVGSQRPTEVDTRVLAATNKDLEKEIETGRFREDLYFRLNVIPFEVPPLRERKEDIPQLLDYFMEVLSPHHGKPGKVIPPEVRDRLLQYHWPGNVRELRNMVERWIIMVPGGRVELSDLPRSILDGAGASRPESRSWQEARAAFESDFLTRMLQENGGNISRTATEIGMERSHLHRKIKAYGISVGVPRGKRRGRQGFPEAARGGSMSR
jgi:two-component system nitrogen regulation response regulator NtrX